MWISIGRANVCRRFDLRLIRIDKQGDQDAGIRQALTGIAHLVALAGDVQPAFGGHFRRFSGTRQQKCGLVSQAIVSISSVTAISRFMRVCSVWAGYAHRDR